MSKNDDIKLKLRDVDTIGEFSEEFRCIYGVLQNVDVYLDVYLFQYETKKSF